MKRASFIAIILLKILTANAQINAVTLTTSQPKQFEKCEWAIDLVGEWQNPYLQEEIALDLLITAPSGNKIVLPCYYETGKSERQSVWKARFSPQEKGKYKYVFRLTQKGIVTAGQPAGQFVAGASQKKGFLHAGDNWTLQFDNGMHFRGIGENIAWESRASDDSKFFKELQERSAYNYEYMLASLAKHGGNFFRTWICAWNLPLDWKKVTNTNRYTNSEEYYNPGAVKMIDRVVSLSDSLGVYMMLTLGPGDYSIEGGGFSANAADFFVNPRSKQRYRNRLRYIIARWGYSTAIGAWEFFNEVDNIQFSNKERPISADSIVQWHDEMSRYLKNIDPYKHIITTSISHRDLNGLNSLSAIDINQKHIYKNTVGIPAAIETYEKRFNKPYVIGEYSYEWDWNKNFNDFPLEMDSDYKRGLWYGLFSPTPVLPMSWWWEFFDQRKTDRYLARVRSISDQTIAAGKGSFLTVIASASDPALKTMAVKCGRTTFIYVYNPTSIVQPAVVQLPVSSNYTSAIQIFDCETGQYQKAAVSGIPGGKAVLNIPSLRANSDVIFILK